MVVGRVRRAHGVRGEVAVEPLGVDAELLAEAETLTVRPAGREVVEHRVDGVRPGSRGCMLVRLEGIADRETAAALGGSEILLDEAELPALEDDEYYFFELVGLEVVDGAGASLGRVSSLFCAGASDVAVVTRPEGEWMCPVVHDIVREIDVAGGRLVVEPIEGLLEGGL